MMINQITSVAGGRQRRKRVGRGESSGLGKTCGRGNKGSQARAGSGPHPFHEGGQMPIIRRLPKRGFNNACFRTEYEVVNVGQLELRFAAGAPVDPTTLKAAGLIQGTTGLVKILGDGELKKKLTVSAHAFSTQARTAIEQAGGTASLIPRRDPPALARAKRKAARVAPAAESPSRLEKKKLRRSAQRVETAG